MPKIDWPEAFDAFTAEYRVLDRLITSFDTDEMMAPSGCRGWTNTDLIFHMLGDAQRALVTLNSPSNGPPDRDFVTYWKRFQASDESAQAHARFVRISASAYSDPKRLAPRWQDTAQAAIHCARSTSEIEFVTTQGHVLSTSDFIATLVVEATVHHLDLLTNLEDMETPAPSALAITSRTLDGLWNQQMPDNWNEVTYILKTTGRQPLAKDESEALGEAADRFPLFS